MQITVNFGAKTVCLTEDNCVVFSYTLTPWVNHVYVYEDDPSQHFVVFHCPDLVTTLLQNACPVCHAEQPTGQDAETYWRYIQGEPALHTEFTHRELDILLKEIDAIL